MRIMEQHDEEANDQQLRRKVIEITDLIALQQRRLNAMIYKPRPKNLIELRKRLEEEAQQIVALIERILRKR
jgi:hypothetical protein